MNILSKITEPISFSKRARILAFGFRGTTSSR
jgi:hypothetical protein